MEHRLTFQQLLKYAGGQSINDIEAFFKSYATEMLTNPHGRQWPKQSGFYVVSYTYRRYLYLNDHFVRLAGLPMQRLYDMDIAYSQKQLLDAERKIHHEQIFSAYLEYFKTIDHTAHADYIMSGTYRHARNEFYQIKSRRHAVGRGGLHHRHQRNTQ